MMNRDDCLRVLHQFRRDGTVVITTMAAVVPWSRLSHTALDFPSASSAMGHAADFAMGIALAQPRRPVWVLNGDGSMLMSLGTLVTICQTPPRNLVVFVLQNDTFEVTGNQPIPGAGTISMAQMARGAGFERVHDFDNVDELSQQLGAIMSEDGPMFINLRVQAEQEPPPKLACLLREPVAELRDVLTAASG